ncbi:MAG: GNAT family N-acetyltransferase [Erysipelotrichaceae bacterium]|nr:GNAT family N-acetyltransferase [Erysipelotrichaceae bacterium]
MKIKLKNKILFETFDHYVLKIDLDDHELSDNELLTIRINKNNCEQVGNAIGNTTRKWILNDYPYAEGYCFRNGSGQQVGSCWIMFKGGDEKLYKVKEADSFIFRMEVDEEYQGRGYAKKIMDHIFAIIKKHGCRNVCLVCARKNIKALHLYESVGMKIVDHKFFIRLLDKNIPYYSI